MNKTISKLWRKRVLLVAGLMALLMVVAGCGTSTTTKSDDKKPAGAQKIQIGGTLALSGTIGPFGKEFGQGIQLAIDDLNARGSNYTYEYQQLDDQYTVPGAVANVQRFTGQGIKYLMGPMGDQGPAIAKIAKDKKMLFVGTYSDPAVNEIAPDFAFTMSNSAVDHGTTIANYVIKKGYKKVAVVSNSNTYGQLISSGVTNTLRKEGVEYISIVTESGQTDYKAELTKIKSSGADVMVACATYTAVLVQAKQMAELGFKIDIVGGPSAFSEALTALGPVGENLVTFTYDAPEGWAKGKEMADKYFAKYGKMNRPESTTVLYDCMMMLAKAIEQSSDPNDTVEVSKNLKAITNYDGVSGPGLAFEKNGFMVKQKATYKKLVAGKWTVFTP